MSHTRLHFPATECRYALAGTHFPEAELAWWLGQILRWFARMKMVTYPSTSCGGRELSFCVQQHLLYN